MDKKERIDELLNRHDLTLEYDNIFDRWFFTLYDRQGEAVWECKGIGMRLEVMRDSLLEFLENYTGSNDIRKWSQKAAARPTNPRPLFDESEKETT